jgi:hypothetical protein
MKKTPLTLLTTIAVTALIFPCLSRASFSPASLEQTDNCFQLPVAFDDAFGLVLTPTVDEPTRDAIFDVFRETYKGKFAAQNLTFEITEDSSTDFGAFAERIGNVARIRVHRGTRYHQRLNPNMYAMILCHELGHHLGGAPRFANSWAAVEGEADYYATLKCWRTVESSLPAFAMTDPVDSDGLEIQTKCTASYPQPALKAERISCQHALKTSLDLTRVLAGLSGFTAVGITASANSKTTVTTTFPFANEPLCRWQTFRPGGLCSISAEVDVEAANGACTTSDSPDAARPHCWFAGSL